MSSFTTEQTENQLAYHWAVRSYFGVYWKDWDTPSDRLPFRGVILLNLHIYL